jgi:hypothetical protein
MADEIIARPDSIDTDEFAFGILCISRETDHLLHLCLYEKAPTRAEFKHLEEELKTDPEFDMQEMVLNKDYDMVGVKKDCIERLLRHMTPEKVREDK